MNDEMISVVVPVYCGKEFLEELCRRVGETIKPLVKNYEIILVNDASPDHCWQNIEALCRVDAHIKGVNLSRNFGQHYAITAGLTCVSGDWIIVMDCDLQDVPEEIPKLFFKAKEGFDIVWAQRVARKDTWHKRISSKIFHSLFQYLSGIETDNSVANFGIVHRKVIKAVLQIKELLRSYPLMVKYVGFKHTAIPIVHEERKAGKSSYSLTKLLNFAFDLIISYSNKPLIIFTKIGFLTTLFSGIVILIYTILYLTGHIKVAGYASIVLSIWLLSGLLMMELGILGIYIGKIFNQVKDRPLFVIDETINLRR